MIRNVKSRPAVERLLSIFVLCAPGALGVTLGNQRVTIDAPPANTCKVPTAVTTLLTRDPDPYLYFEAAVTAQDSISNDWLAPDGGVFNGSQWGSASGTFCYAGALLTIRPDQAPNLAGQWYARIFDNGKLIFSVPFKLINAPTVTNQRVTQDAPATSGCAVPASVASFTASANSSFLYFEATVTTDELLTNDWRAPDGTIITGGAWNPASGRYCFTGARLAIPSPLAAAQLGIWQARVFDNGSLLFLVSFQIASAAPSPNMIVTSLSVGSSLPLVPIQIATSHPNNPPDLRVVFSSPSGFSVSERPIRVALDGTVTAAVPIYVDPKTHAIADGAVSVSLSSGGVTSNSMPLNIQELPTLASYGVRLGEISHTFLNYETMLLGRQINTLQAIQSLPGNVVNTTGAQKTQATLLQSIIRARRDVDRVLMNNSLVIDGGTLADGTPVHFDKTSLELMDRVIGMRLNQLTSIVGASISASSTSQTTLRQPKIRNAGLVRFPHVFDPPRARSIRQSKLPKSFVARFRSNPRAVSPKDILDLMHTVNGVAGLVQTVQGYVGSHKEWYDDVLGVAGVSGYFAGIFVPGPFPEQVEAGVGILVAAGSLIVDTDRDKPGYRTLLIVLTLPQRGDRTKVSMLSTYLQFGCVRGCGRFPRSHCRLSIRPQ